MEVYSKSFIMLDKRIECGCRDINYPIISKPILHNHDGYEFLLVINGRIEAYTEGESRILERGDFFCANPYEFHHVRLITPEVYDRVVINFREYVLDQISSEHTDLRKCFLSQPNGKLKVYHLDEEKIQHFVSTAKELEQSLDDNGFGSDLLAISSLMKLLVIGNRCVKDNFLSVHEGTMPEIVSDTFAYVEQHLTEELSLIALEKHLKYSGTYISRCFKKTMGITLQQYIIAKRLALAQQYLQQGISPSDVCFMTGFNNYSNFSRTFMQYTGISPKKYQTTHANK